LKKIERPLAQYKEV